MSCLKNFQFKIINFIKKKNVTFFFLNGIVVVVVLASVRTMFYSSPRNTQPKQFKVCSRKNRCWSLEQ